MAKKRKMRPFKDIDPDDLFPYPTCGRGKNKQWDINDKLFDVPSNRSGLRFDELAQLTEELNSVFAKRTETHLRQRQQQLGSKALQITLALCDGRLYLTYAIPVAARRRLVAKLKRTGKESGFRRTRKSRA